jgi:phage terminase large subunit
VRPEAEKLRQWTHEPWAFVREVLCAEPDDWQQECLEAAVRGDLKRFALKACKGPGKSTLLAWVMWWFMVTRPMPKIVATSISADNLEDNLWAELSKWQQQSRLLRANFEWTKSRVYERNYPETWFMSARSWPKSASPEQMADTLAGIHADHVLFVLDESGGIPPAVMATAEAGLANVDKGEGREAMLWQAGNPTDVNGALYEACVRHRALWWVKEISGDPEDPKRAKRVSIDWARELISKYGREHPWVLVNVMGKFPPGGSNALISADTVSEAAQRKVGPREFEQDPKVLGVDVARFGDDETVIALRQGAVAYRMKVFRNLDLMETAGQVALSIQKHKPSAIFIDATGIGAGVVDRLRELKYRVTGVEFGGKALQKGYLNRRAEMWGEMAEWLKHGAIPDDPQLMADLPGPTYRYRSDGALQLEAKEDMKKRGMPSPNRGDALALTFAMPVAHPGSAHHAANATHTRDYDPFGSTVDYDPFGSTVDYTP